MAIFTGTATAFNSTNRVLHNESVLLLSQSVSCHLYTQANAPVVANERLADTAPMSGGGYPGLVVLGTKAIELISGKNYRFTAAPIEFVAGVGGIVDAYWYAIFENTTADKWLISFGQLDNTPGAVSAAQGDKITINPDVTNGFLRFATTS